MHVVPATLGEGERLGVLLIERKENHQTLDCTHSSLEEAAVTIQNTSALDFGLSKIMVTSLILLHPKFHLIQKAFLTLEVALRRFLRVGLDDGEENDKRRFEAGRDRSLVKTCL